MIVWLWDKLVGQFCRHRWEERGHSEIIDEEGDKIKDKFFLRCTKCGNMKCKKL